MHIPKADSYTYQLMVQVCQRELYLSLDNVRDFPCEDLLRIDDLWLMYSNGKLGFSVQKDIWVDVGGKLDFGKDFQAANKAFEKMGDVVGWRVNGDWKLTKGINYDFPGEGCLPCRGLMYVDGTAAGFAGFQGWVRWFFGVRGWRGCVVVFSRIQACKV